MSPEYDTGILHQLTCIMTTALKVKPSPEMDCLCKLCEADEEVIHDDHLTKSDNKYIINHMILGHCNATATCILQR